MTLLEQRLRAAVAELMNLRPEDVSVTADLGEQGIDSLLGLRLARKIGELTGTEIEFEWLFDYPSISQLAQFLEQRAADLAAASMKVQHG